MIQVKHRFKVVKGGDIAKKLIEFHRNLAKRKAITYSPWDIVGKHLIKHAKDDYWRGYIVQTFHKFGVDLSQYVPDKTRIPGAPALDNGRVSEGLREFALPDGNRIELKSVVEDPDKLLADILNDTTAPMAEFMRAQLATAGLKPEGGRR